MPNLGEQLKQNVNSAAMPNLGQLLKKNIQSAADAQAEAARKKADKEQKERQEKSDAVAGFFAHAKKHITEAILAGESGLALQVLLGRTPSKNNFVEVERVLHYAGIGLVTNGTGTHESECAAIAAPLWAEFQDWANQSGLRLSWDYDTDGGGMYSWSILRAFPQD